MKSIRELVTYYIGNDMDRVEEVLEYYNKTLKSGVSLIFVLFFVMVGLVGLAFLIGTAFPSNGKVPKVEEFGSAILAMGLFILAMGLGAYIVFTDVYNTAVDMKKKIAYYNERVQEDYDFDDDDFDDFEESVHLPLNVKVPKENVGEKDYEKRDSTEQDKYVIR